MMAATFDTLQYSKRLQTQGFTPQQAEAQVEMIKEIIDEQVASQQDIKELTNDLLSSKNELKHDIEGVRFELKHDIQDVRTELKHDFESVKSEIKQSENRTVIRLGVMLVSAVGVFSILLTVIGKIH